jgi:cell wall-associated protease
MKKIIIAVALLSSMLVKAQDKRPDNWFNMDPTNDKINGVSTERTYAELLKDKKSNTIIVAVLDSGVDFLHEDLKDVMWANPGEIPGNGIDDDKNGYVDDIHGWNFQGGKTENVHYDNLEVTRLVRKYKPKFDGKAETDFTTKEDKADWAFYQKLKKSYEETKARFEPSYNQVLFLKNGITKLNATLKEKYGIQKITLVDVQKFDAQTKEEKQFKAISSSMMKEGATMDEVIAELKEGEESLGGYVNYGLNLDYDPRVTIVKDNYDDPNDRFYGNADCKGPDAFHGTHVAGIIAASRKNGVGMDGVAANVRIMSVRCVPAGDERDKDVANAIRYAVDNGAKIINMSFGKAFSWNKKVVDDAVKYAESKGVLLMHAAGNDSKDIDTEIHFPCKKFEGKGEASNFMYVGALSWKPGDKVVAKFSNYGKKTVDIFSPGVEIYSTTPENKYKDASGTSMATPVACGVAAVLKSYYPELTPQQIKKILIKSSLKTYKNEKVIKPGTKDELIKFSKLGKNGGVVNLYEAIKMANGMKKVVG